jgi:hypothetical protein
MVLALTSKLAPKVTVWAVIFDQISSGKGEKLYTTQFSGKKSF